MRTSCIRLRANSRLAILFEDFLEICDGDMLAALLLAILVYWTDIKLAKKDTNLWIWKSHEDFQEDLMVDKPGMKPPHRTTISSKLDDLQAKDFIEWRKNPKLALDRTRHYLVHLPEVQAAIDRLPPIVSRKTDIRLLENRHSTEEASEVTSDELPNVEKPTVAESRFSDNALSEKQQCIVGKPTSNTNDYITEITSSEITEEGTYGANAPTPAHLLKEVDEKLEEVEEELERITGEHPAIHTNETSYHIANGSAIGNEEDEPVLSAPRLTLPSKKGLSHDDRHDTPHFSTDDHSNVIHDKHADAVQDHGHAGLAPTTARGATSHAANTTQTHEPREQRITSQQAPGALTRVQAQPLSAPTPAQAEFPPAGSTEPAPTARASGFTPPKRPTLKSDPRDVQKRIDANRGYALEEKVEVIRERQAIKTWCSLHEIGECDLVLRYLTTQDKYWKLEENKHRIGGVTLAKETPKALAALERKGQPAQGPPPDWIPDETDYSLAAEFRRDELRAGGAK